MSAASFSAAVAMKAAIYIGGRMQLARDRCRALFNSGGAMTMPPSRHSEAGRHGRYERPCRP